MSEWTDVTHREECQIRPASEDGEVVSTLAGPQRVPAGGFVLRRRLVPAEAQAASDEELRETYMQRYQQAAPEDASRDSLLTALGYGWEERPADSDYVEYHFRTEELDFAEQGSEEDYDGWTNADLAAEIDRRNGERDAESVIHVDPPGNKAELLAALRADDERSSDS